jgi:hypothetical protein
MAAKSSIVPKKIVGEPEFQSGQGPRHSRSAAGSGRALIA